MICLIRWGVIIMIDKWANFLAAEKLTPRIENPMVLVKLAEELAQRGIPYFRPYQKRIESRRLVVDTAIDLGIDLTGIKFNGKIVMARSLLDIWNEEYKKRFGDNVGTAGWREDKRRIAKRGDK